MKYTMKNPLVLCADFETDYDPETEGRYICQWGISYGTTTKSNVQGEDEIPYSLVGITKESFIEYLEREADKAKFVDVVFHNLKYDSSYILDYLDGFVDKGYSKLEAVDDMGTPKFLSYNYLENGHVVKSIRFKDSAALYSRPLREIAKALGYQKLSPPEHAEEFLPGWSVPVNAQIQKMHCSDPMLRYVSNDAWVVAKLMESHRKPIKLPDGTEWTFTQPTASGCAYKLLQYMVEQSHRRCVEENCKAKGQKPPSYTLSFSKIFPPLPAIPTGDMGALKMLSDKEYDELVGLDLVTDNEIREAYCGGVNYSDRSGLADIGDGKQMFHIDFHSMYPSQMVKK